MKCTNNELRSSVGAENPYLPRPYKVLEHYQESMDTFTLTVDMAVHHEPGQFVQVSIPGIGEAPISIASYASDHIKMSIHEVGTVTKALSQLRVGDTLLIRGPYGRGYPMEQLKGNNLLIVGGGCGVAPLKGIIEYVEQHRSDFKDISLFLGYHSSQSILFRRELDNWKAQFNVAVTIGANEGAVCYQGTTGHITDPLEAMDLTNENKVVFLCGPPGMIKAVTALLSRKGFHNDQIFVSAERLMYCAVGACCHCMIRDKFTCKDGPVFRYDEIAHITND